jgi:hypothetical protein
MVAVQGPHYYFPSLYTHTYCTYVHTTSYKHSFYYFVRVSRGVYRAVAWQCVDISQLQFPNWQEMNLWPSALHGYNRWILRGPQSGGFGLQLRSRLSKSQSNTRSIQHPHNAHWTMEPVDVWKLGAAGSCTPLPLPHFNSYTQFNLERHHLHVKHCHTWTEITFTMPLCNGGATKSPLQLEMEMDVDECRRLLLTISHSA